VRKGESEKGDAKESTKGGSYAAAFKGFTVLPGNNQNREIDVVKSVF
jgi:hypothetical protein